VLATLGAKHVSSGDIECFSINKQILTNNESNAKGAPVIRGYHVSRADELLVPSTIFMSATVNVLFKME
jgi:hypothetical protein